MAAKKMWQIKDWICGGFQAVRPDGEKVFVYHRLAWEPARYAEKCPRMNSAGTACAPAG